jgi:hypothetical protein
VGTPPFVIPSTADLSNALARERHSQGASGVIGATSIRYGCPADREMTISNQLVRAATDPDPYGWRATTVRVLANALLVFLAYEVVTMTSMAAMIASGWPPPLPPVELVLMVTAFVLVRWIFVLPGLLPVLVGLDCVARRAPHPRVLTAIVAFAPMVWWELTNSPGGFSEQGAVLGLTAVLFAVLARLPARTRGHSTEDRGAAQPPAEPAVAPR